MQVGVLKFSNRTTVSFHMNRYDSVLDLVEAIKALTISGGETNIASALRVARTQMFLDRVPASNTTVPRLLILITDGEATVERSSTMAEANLAKEAGIRIFTVGIGRRINEVQLKAIATSPWESHYFFVSDFSALHSVVQDVLASSCNELVIDTLAPPPTTVTTPTTTTTTTTTTSTTSTTTSTMPTPTTTSTTTTSTTTTTPTTTTRTTSTTTSG